MRNRPYQFKYPLIAVSAAAVLAATLVTMIATGITSGETAPRVLAQGKLLHGIGSVGDWTNDAPGVRHLVRLSDLPAPYATPNIGNNPHVVPRPTGSMLKAPDGFKVEQYAQGLEGPRLIRSAPNGDIFVAESGSGPSTFQPHPCRKTRGPPTHAIKMGLLKTLYTTLPQSASS